MKSLQNKPKRVWRTKAEMMKDTSKDEPKIKRTRRTKIEMLAFRTPLIKEESKDALKPKKSSHRSDLDVEYPIYEPIDPALISGWVNVHKKGDGYWLGSDIHYTIDDAKKIGGHNLFYLKTIQISFPIEGV